MGQAAYQFMAGLITMGYLIAGLFFLRFWARTRDSLFACFAAAFWLMAATQGLLAVANVMEEERSSWIYVLRVAAFGLIIAAVLVKNGSSRR